MKKNWLTKTITTILLMAILITIFILLNLWAKNINLPMFDITPEKLYSLSNDSKAQMEKIQKEVVMYFFGYEENSVVIDLAKQYQECNEHIMVEVVDLTARPDLKEEYGLESDTQAIVVEAGSKSKIIMPNELYSYDYTTGEEIDLIEQKLTNAVLDTTIDKKPNVYVLTSHGEYSINSESSGKTMQLMAAYIVNDINNINSLDLLVEEKVPENCDVLMIATPEKDFSEVETNKIIDYIQRGGKILWLNDPVFSQQEFTNIQRILDLYGISFGKGIMVETDSARIVFQNPELIRPDVATHRITQGIDTDGGVMFMDATKINLVGEEEREKLNLTVNELLRSSEKSFFRSDLSISSYSATEKDEKGSALLGAEIVKKVKEDTESTLIVYASNLFASDTSLTIGNSYAQVLMLYNNKDLVLNSIAYLSEREDAITIRKNVGSVTYTATQQQHNIIQAVIFSVPVIIIIAGLVVWQIRRRKK